MGESSMARWGESSKSSNTDQATNLPTWSWAHVGGHVLAGHTARYPHESSRCGRAPKQRRRRTRSGLVGTEGPQRFSAEPALRSAVKVGRESRA